MEYLSAFLCHPTLTPPIYRHSFLRIPRIASKTVGTRLACPTRLTFGRPGSHVFRGPAVEMTSSIPIGFQAELDHVALCCADPLVSAKWYSSVIGFAAIDFVEYENGSRPFPSVRVSSNSILDFFPRGDGDANRSEENMNHICFAVATRAQLDEVIDRLIAAGHPPANPVPQERSGARGTGLSIYARDIDGTLIEFRTYPQ